MALTIPSTPSAFNLSCFDRTDNAHAIRSTTTDYLDANGNPLEACTQVFKDSREAHSVVEWKRLAGGDDPAAALVRDVLLANNANAERYRVQATKPNSNALLIWPLQSGKSDSQEAMDNLARALCCVLQCKRPLMHPPQEVEAKLKRPEYGSPRAFLITNLSKEHYEEITLTTYYCVRLGPDSVVSFGVAPWDLTPCRYLATLRDVGNVDFTNPDAKQMVLDGLREHVSKRADTIHHFVGSNKQLWWGGNTAIANMSFVRDRLVPQIYVKPLIQLAKPEVQREALYRFIVYAPGIFNEDRNNLREGWRQAVLGPTGGKVDIGFGEATIAHKDWLCTYCLQISHTIRLCPILHHPIWFDGAREELENEDNKLAAAYRATEGKRAQRDADDLARRVASRGGRGGSRGTRGSGRGGNRGARGSGCGGRGHQFTLTYGRG